jgi:hypothetical protein
MAVDIDSLQIEIEATSSDAAKKIEALTTALTGLKTAAKGGAGLTTTTKQLKALSEAAKLINGANLNSGKIKEFTAAMNSLAGIQKANGLSSTINALRKLPEISASLEKTDLGKFAKQMEQVAAAVRPLATEMQKVSNGFSAFPIRIQRLIQSNASLTASNSRAARSFGVLGTGISSAAAKFSIYYLAFKRLADVISGWIKSANDYVETVNLFQVSMGEFYDEAYNYAMLVNDRLGIDPEEWMRAQGVFMSMANGFGLARQQAYDLSEGLTELAYDLSSLYNEDTEQSVLRLQSALAGEIEPIRRLGISISQATLQEYALAHGIDESVAAMTEQEKALLRSLVLMEGASRIGAIGDFAKTLESPANAMRVLRQQITQLGRATGTVFVPILIQVIPWVQAFVEILTEAIQRFAVLVGFEMPEWETNDWGEDIKENADSAADSVGDTTDELKKLKQQLLGIDELNIIGASNEIKLDTGETGKWTDDLEIPDIWDKTALDALKKQVDEIKPVLKDLLDNYIIPIGSALLAWRIARTLFTDIGRLKALLGGLMFTVGISLLIDSVKDILFGDGLTWENILKGAAGGALAGAGLGLLLAKKLGLTWAGGMLLGAVVGLGLSLMVMSIISEIKNGVDAKSALIKAIGGALAGGAIGGLFAFKMGINLAQGVIGGITAGVGLSLVITSIIDIAQNGLDIGNVLMDMIGGALTGAGIGTVIAGGFGAALGLIIGVGISLVFAGITDQISSGEASIGDALMTILGSALAGAGIGSVIPGIGTAAGAVIGLGVGIVLEIVGVEAAANAAYAASEDFAIMADILDRCTEASERTDQAFTNMKNRLEDFDSSIADFQIARQLADEIYAINENTDASAYALEQMAVKVQVLNDLNIDGLHLEIDETTQRVKESKAAVDELIDSLEREAKMEALREMLVESYKEQYQAMRDMQQAAKDYDAAAEALNNTQKELNETDIFSWGKARELVAAREKETEAAKAAQETYMQSVQLYSDLQSETQGLTDSIIGLKQEESGVGDAGIDGMEDLKTEINHFSQSIDMSQFENLGKQMADNMYKGFTSSGLLQDAIKNLGNGASYSSENSSSRSANSYSVQDITAYASGGFPEHGQMFIAREDGPELVGQIGNRAAVANNDQIVDGIASANTGVINAVMAIGAMITKAVNDKDTTVSLDGRQVSRSLYKYNQQMQREKGAPIT